MSLRKDIFVRNGVGIVDQRATLRAEEKVAQKTKDVGLGKGRDGGHGEQWTEQSQRAGLADGLGGTGRKAQPRPTPSSPAGSAALPCNFTDMKNNLHHQSMNSHLQV